MPGVRPATPAELPAGAPAGTRCTLPVVDMGRYLPWLAAACASAGVQTVPGRVTALSEVAGDVVVVAAGLASGRLLGDHSLVPVQGQVVRLADPGLTGWVLDDHHPDGLTYVVPRGRDVVCGGTAVEGATGTAPDPAVETAVRSGCGRAGPPSGWSGSTSTDGRWSPATGTAAPASPSPGAAPPRSPPWSDRGHPARAASAIAAYRAAPSGSTASSNTTRLEWLPAALAGSAPGGQAPRKAIAPGTRCST